MAKKAIVIAGGKQYLVQEKDVIYVDRIAKDPNDSVELETLSVFDSENDSYDIGKPFVEKKVKAKILDNLKADKIRVAKFKAKVRYRNVRGYRHSLSKLQIESI